jgi:hypothetical protein
MCSRIGRSWNLLAAGPDLMVLALAIATRPRWTLVLGNLAACALFVILRPPASPDYIADVAAARAESVFVINSGISGMVACRLLYPWSQWHGGEALGVKVLEVANAPAVAVTVSSPSAAGPGCSPACSSRPLRCSGGWWEPPQNT